MINKKSLIRIEELRNYAPALFEQFRPQDKFLVVRFNQNVKISTGLTDDRQKITRAILGFAIP